jgi:hypothetical protein
MGVENAPCGWRTARLPQRGLYDRYPTRGNIIMQTGKNLPREPAAGA